MKHTLLKMSWFHNDTTMLTAHLSRCEQTDCPVHHNLPSKASCASCCSSCKELCRLRTARSLLWFSLFVITHPSNSKFNIHEFCINYAFTAHAATKMHVSVSKIRWSFDHAACWRAVQPFDIMLFVAWTVAWSSNCSRTSQSVNILNDLCNILVTKCCTADRDTGFEGPQFQLRECMY